MPIGAPQLKKEVVLRQQLNCKKNMRHSSRKCGELSALFTDHHAV